MSRREAKQKERRERIATAVLAGLAAGDENSIGWPEDDDKETGTVAAECAVEWADALIAELDKEEPA